MNCNFTLNAEQQTLVESNLVVIDKVISRYINVNEGVCGLGHDDLYQEGAIALCQAAATYDGTSAKFSTYAFTVVRNHLFSHCKTVNTGQRNLPVVSLERNSGENGELMSVPELSCSDCSENLIAELDTTDFLTDCKRRFSGVARLGVEALELKINGLSGTDIAGIYGVKPNQVGAWISRATQKIRKERLADGIRPSASPFLWMLVETGVLDMSTIAILL